MTPAEIKQARRKLGLRTQQALAETLGVHRVTVANWERDKYPIPAIAENFIKFMLENNCSTR